MPHLEVGRGESNNGGFVQLGSDSGWQGQHLRQFIELGVLLLTPRARRILRLLLHRSTPTRQNGSGWLLKDYRWMVTTIPQTSRALYFPFHARLHPTFLVFFVAWCLNERKHQSIRQSVSHVSHLKHFLERPSPTRPKIAEHQSKIIGAEHETKRKLMTPTAMVLTEFSQNIPVSAPDGIKNSSLGIWVQSTGN